VDTSLNENGLNGNRLNGNGLNEDRRNEYSAYEHLQSTEHGRLGAKSLRILMVTARYIPYIGGTEIHTYEVAHRMAAAGHDVTVLTTDVSKSLPLVEFTDGVRVLRVPAWPAKRDYYFAPAIHKIIMDGEWDMIHCQGYHTLVAPIAMLAAYQSGTPYVVTFHSGGHPSRFRNALRGLQRWMLRPLLARAQKLIGVSPFETEFFQKHLQQPTDRFETISNGSYLPKPTSNRVARDGTLIVSVGRLERYKGHHRTIMALPEVAEQYPDVHLRIIGAGPYELELRQLAKRIGMAPRVNIGPVATTERSQMASILSNAKLAILLSDYEAQGIAILEALSLGIPALVTHTSGLADLAKGGLVRSVPLNSSSPTIASAILEQLQKPLIASNIQLPSWDHCTARLLQLYYEVRGQRSPIDATNDLLATSEALPTRQANSRYLSGTNGSSVTY
jgi:glycosyltransferase involved in cell wall biosynthesis